MNNRLILQGGLAAALCLAAPWASALTVDLNKAASPMANISTTTNGGWSWSHHGVGPLKGTLDGKSFTTYCVELNQPLSWYSKDYALANFSPADKNMLDRLYTVASDKVTDLTKGIAFQLAVWEITHENLDKFQTKYAPGSSGLFGGANLDAQHATAFATANQWLADAKALDASKISWSTQKLTNGHYQDYVLAVAVPEPETYAMMLAGLGLVGMIARRKQARAGKLETPAV